MKSEQTREIGGKAYRFHLTIGAMCQVEQLLSTPQKDVSFQMALQMIGRQSLTHMRAVLWGALRQYHGTVTLEQVNDLIEAMGETDTLALVFGLIRDTSPDQQDIAELEVGRKKGSPRQARATRGTGASST